MIFICNYCLRGDIVWLLEVVCEGDKSIVLDVLVIVVGVIYDFFFFDSIVMISGCCSIMWIDVDLVSIIMVDFLVVVEVIVCIGVRMFEFV